MRTQIFTYPNMRKRALLIWRRQFHSGCVAEKKNQKTIPFRVILDRKNFALEMLEKYYWYICYSESAELDIPRNP